MPTFDQLTTSHLIKTIYLGDTGAGKTGSLCALGAAGYNVRILDLDNGVELIKDYVLNPASPYRNVSPGHWTSEQVKGIASRMSYVTVTEGSNIVNGKPVPKGDSWEKINKLLDNWVDGEAKFGNVGSWTDRDVLVVDGLSRLAVSAFNFQLRMGGRLIAGKPEQSDWFLAQDMLEKFLVMLQGPSVPCHVIIVCHVAYIEKDDGLTRGFPQTVGKALSPKIGQWFNHALLAKSTGQGAGLKRRILTSTTGTIDLKSPAPLRVKPEYDLGTGLADYWKDVTGQSGPQAPPVQVAPAPVAEVKK